MSPVIDSQSILPRTQEHSAVVEEVHAKLAGCPVP